METHSFETKHTKAQKRADIVIIFIPILIFLAVAGAVYYWASVPVCTMEGCL